MANPLTRRRRLYLRRELHKVHGAVEAARMLSEAVATDQLGPDHDHRSAPRAIASLLLLVGERLQYLRRSARHRSDPPEALAQVASSPPEELTQATGDPPAASSDERVLAMCAQQQHQQQQRARGSRVVRAA